MSEGGGRRRVCLSAAVLILHQVRLRRRLLLRDRSSDLFRRHITGHDPHGALHLAEVDARRREADVVPEICAGGRDPGEGVKNQQTKEKDDLMLENVSFGESELFLRWKVSDSPNLNPQFQTLERTNSEGRGTTEERTYCRELASALRKKRGRK